jgi:hypothetical protein
MLCNREKQTKFFYINGDAFYCNNIDELMRALGDKHKPEIWKLFTDFLKLNLKAIRLHSGKDLLSLPVWLFCASDRVV